MRSFRFRSCGVVWVALLLSGCAGSQRPQPILTTVSSGRLTWAGEVPVLHLYGSPYQIGFQHGTLLREGVRASVANMNAFINRGVGIPLAGRWLARRKLDQTWRQMEPFVPADYLEELRGLSEGAGVPLRALQRIHALPELMATTCASFAACGAATRDGRLIQIRNLDWAIQSDVQQYAAVFVVRPEGRAPFISIGWLGFIGVISGINNRGVSVSEIGSKTSDFGLKGIPMPFLLRRVLEESDGLDKAVALVKEAHRTGGYNYLFADAQQKKAVALETTHSQCAVFWIDQEPKPLYALPVPNTIFRSDWSMDPAVRDRQRSSRGDPRKPGLESPEGSKAYDVRYRGQGLLLRQFHGRIDPEVAMAIARAIAPSSNVQSVVYAYPELWVANAVGRKPAAQGKYFRLDLKELFEETN